MKSFAHRSLALVLFGLIVSMPLRAATPPAAPNPFAENVRPTAALTPEQELKSFHLPPGFKIQLVASEPDIHKPINIAIDAKGRLWVTSTIEYPLPVRDPNVKPRDEVKVLEIDPATGRATKVTTFADGLNIPTGVYPYKNGAIAYSIPNIYYLQDTDGDGVADKRDVLYGPFDTTRDTHGLTNSFTRGFDGFLYATHGFNNRSTLNGADGSSIYMDSGNVYRMTLDGAHVDLITHGPVNPFGLMFDSNGTLYVADCHTKPFQVVLRGAWFEHFGRAHDGIGFYPKIMGHLHGSTAIGGVVTIDDLRWPEEFQHNLICGNPVTSRVDRDSLDWHGSTPTAIEKPDFVASDDPWFRPVAFALSPDGSIYVADFYNKIIGHYEVPLTHPGRDRTSGRIWRIVPPLAKMNSDVDQIRDFSTASIPQLINALGHPNITGRMLAIDQLTDRIGKDVIAPAHEALAKGDSFQKVGAMWVLYRLGAITPEEISAAAIDPTDRMIRAHAAHLLSEQKTLTTEQRQLLVPMLKDADPIVQRNALDALGMHPATEDVRPLLDAIRTAPKADTHLIYVARIALRNHLERPAILAGLPLPNWSEADAATVNDILPAIKTPQAATYIIAQLKAGKLTGGSTNELLRLAARFGDDAGADAAANYAKDHLNDNADARLEALKAIQDGVSQRGGKLSDTTHAWAADLVTSALHQSAKDPKRLTTIADLAKSLALKECAAPLAAVMSDSKADPASRLAAIKTVLALDPASLPAVAAIVADANQPANIREAAAKALSEINSDEARQALLMPIRVAPQALAAKLAVALASRPEGAATLLDAVERNTILPRLLLEPTVKDKLTAAKLKDLDARIAKLTQNLAPASEQLDKLIAAKRAAFNPKKGNIEKGKEVFTKTCAICHQLDGQGALVGPQLDGIGARGLDRLLEDVIDPNRNVDPMFRYSNITLKDGDTISGLSRGEAGANLLLIDLTGKENPIPKAEIQSIEVSKLSLMPTGFGEIIPADEFNNLMTFLLSQTAPPKKQ
ncbi:MAG: putative rane-bound dehydrogenase [Phycisphaerales bacterium]|nr:putative rane-bound dehydrogenase [Phycisphaerales bacterium]